MGKDMEGKVRERGRKGREQGEKEKKGS